MSSRRHFQTFRQGFTLIELLFVIAIIAILAVIVIIAINPARQLAQANNAQRRSNIATIMSAVGQYAISNRGVLPSTITNTPTQICRTGVSTSSCAGGVDLGVLTTNKLHLSVLPIDPTGFTVTSTGYFISKSTSTPPRVTVTAPSAELGETISVTR